MLQVNPPLRQVNHFQQPAAPWESLELRLHENPYLQRQSHTHKRKTS